MSNGEVLHGNTRKHIPVSGVELWSVGGDGDEGCVVGGGIMLKLTGSDLVTTVGAIPGTVSIPTSESINRAHEPAQQLTNLVHLGLERLHDASSPPVRPQVEIP